jgi:hypothetical protein
MGVQNIETGIVGENRVTGVVPLKFSISLAILEISLHISITNFQSKITWQPLEIHR